MRHNSFYNVTQHVTDYDAINIFRLKQSDLRKLKYERRYIPGISRQGMRLRCQTALYKRSDIEAAVKRKREAAEAKQQARRNKELARRQRRMQAAGAAKDQIRQFSSCKRARSSSEAGEKHGDVKLPDAVLQHIIGCLAAVEADGVRGPCLVAGDLANAALVSWDFYNAAKHGFVLLQQQVEKLHFMQQYSYRYDVDRALRRLPMADGWTWQQWAAFLSDPLPYKVPDLKEAAKQLFLTRTGTKAQLVVRVLGAFGLSAPSKAPPQLLRALALERIALRPWLGAGALVEARSALSMLFLVDEGLPAWGPGITRDQHKAAGSAAAWRKLLAAAGVKSKAQLLQLTSSAEARYEEIRQQQREAAQAAAVVAAAALTGGGEGAVPAGGMQEEAEQQAAAAAVLAGQEVPAPAAAEQGEAAQQAAAHQAAPAAAAYAMAAAAGASHEEAAQGAAALNAAEQGMAAV
ncbi:hypothetical protein COO60DRAFT_58690 [Scenedesmus sp. NREL 46B-D3]|nr:hypothetical protein COO60DRAFT_58690 [Scenedesmus sp. NREL 46B-D3]